MTRIESAASFQDKESLKKEIRHEIRGEDRRKKLAGCGGCLLLVLAIVGIPAAIALTFLARTGFVEVPGLTQALYRPSEPLRNVLPFKGTSADQVMQMLPAKSSFDPLTSTLKLPVTEQEFTTVMQHAAVTPPNPFPFPVTRLQMAVEPDMVQVFAVTPRHGREVTVRMSFKPVVRDGELTVTQTDVLLGGQQVPAKLAQPFFNFFAKSIMDQMRGNLGVVGKLTDIKLAKGTMTLVFYRQ